MAVRYFPPRAASEPKPRSFTLPTKIARQIPRELLALTKTTLIRDIRAVFGCAYGTAWHAVRIAREGVAAWVKPRMAESPTDGRVESEPVGRDRRRPVTGARTRPAGEVDVRGQFVHDRLILCNGNTGGSPT